MTRTLPTRIVVQCMVAGMLVFSITNAQLRIEITQGVARPVPMAIVPFSWEGSVGSQVPFDVSGLVTTDLVQSGRFDPLDERDMVSRPTMPEDVDFDDWQILDVDVLVIGRILPAGPDQ